MPMMPYAPNLPWLFGPLTRKRNAMLSSASVALFDRAVADGWTTDGGFVYTTDWDGVPVVRDRLHWVVAEAISAAACLHRHTGEERLLIAYDDFWDHAAELFIDTGRGSWRHQLAPDGTPDDTVWSGKPDLYHAFQATLQPRLPLWPMITTAVAEGRLE